MMVHLLKASRMIEKITDTFGKAASYLIYLLMFVIIYEVVARRLFTPTLWAFDVTYMIFGAHFMLVTAFALKYKAHVRTDIIYRGLSVRVQGILDSILYFVIFLPGIGAFFWVSYNYFLDSWLIRESTVMSPWSAPIYPLKFCLFLGVGMLLLQGIAELIKAIHAAKYNKWPEESPLMPVVPLAEGESNLIDVQVNNQENSQECSRAGSKKDGEA